MADGWEIVEALDTEEEATLVCGYLESQGIPCQLDSAQSHEFPVEGGNVRIEVPSDRLEEARRLLAERETSDVLGDDEAQES